MLLEDLKAGDFFELENVEFEVKEMYPRIAVCYELDELSDRIPTGRDALGKRSYKIRLISDYRFNKFLATEDEKDALSIF